MFQTESLVYLASREAFYHCFGSIDNFQFHAHDHCLCSWYSGCVRSPSAKEDYCAVCRINEHYSLERLKEIKHNSFKLERVYLTITRDVAEVLSVDSSIYFWKSDYYNWICFTNETEYWDLFRENIDHVFRSKNVEWSMIEPIDY